MSESQTDPQKSSVNKKYMKLGIAALAALALIIGLAVGLGQRNAANRNVSASLAEGGYEEWCDEPDVEQAPKQESGYGKSGKSSKSGKGSKRRRELIVPGTEDYRKVNLGLGSRSSAIVRPFGQGERRGQGLSLDPDQPDSGYGKSSKSGSGSKSSKGSYGSGSKSSKSGGGKGSKSGYCDDQCGSSKGGKSGSGCYGGSKSSKGSKSGDYDGGDVDEEPDYSCPSPSPTICHSKSSKGGSGKSSKSGGPGGSKSTKSSKASYDEPDLPSPTPPLDTTPPQPTPPPTPAESFINTEGSTPTVGKEQEY